MCDDDDNGDDDNGDDDNGDDDNGDDGGNDNDDEISGSNLIRSIKRRRVACK